ncbi:hypothetical protein [Jiangella alba]|uniref:hypothetical protein n=1 Tax=Jiangella alba TaxID=561176 RepID=UPI00083F4357|nr:hypothetical protein [Jiangella alba]
MPGCYASAAVVAAASPWAAHRLVSRAFALYSGGSTCLTGWSAVATWQLPTVGPAPSRVSAIRPDGTGHKVQQGVYGDIRVVSVPPDQVRRAQVLA